MKHSQTGPLSSSKESDVSAEARGDVEREKERERVQLTVVDDRGDGVGYGEDAALAVECLARVGARVGVARVGDGERAFSVLVCREASRLLANMAPVQAPVYERRRKAGRLALDANSAAERHGYISDRAADNSGLFYSTGQSKATT